MQALKHLTLELEECFSLEEKYSERFNINTQDSYHRKIIPPLLSLSECGSYTVYGCAEIPIMKSGKKNPTVSIENLQKDHNIDLSDSMLQLMPYLSKLQPSNLVPLHIDGIDDRYVIVNNNKVLHSYCPDLYSKCIIRIPQEINEEISIYQYPSNGIISLEDLVSLFVEGTIDENRDTPRKHNKDISQEREHVKECNFTAHGCKMKILLYDRVHHTKNTLQENERAKAVFMSRDDRIFRMAALSSKPDSLMFITNNLFTNSIIGESEVISGDVLFIVEQ